MIPRTRVVRGRVIDEMGEPFSGAEIWGIPLGNDGLAPAVLTHSASDGSFSVEDVAWLTWLSARSTGHRPSLSVLLTLKPPVPLPGRELLFQLGPPGGRVRGRVLDENGQAIPRAHVRVGPRGGDPVSGPDGQSAWRSMSVPMVTDEHGEFLLPHDLAAGIQPVSVAARSWQAWEGELEVRAGEIAELEVRLTRSSRVTGVVKDRLGKPVAGAQVAGKHTVGAFRQGNLPPTAPWTTTDHEGRFVLESMSPGRQPVQASAPWPKQLGTAREWVECLPGQSHDVELTLDPGAELRGRLVDSEKRALGAWHVSLDGTSVATDEEGRFLFANLDANSSYDLHVHGPQERYMQPRSCFRELWPGSSEETFVVQDTSPATGRSSDESNSAEPAGIQVTFLPTLP